MRATIMVTALAFLASAFFTTSAHADDPLAKYQQPSKASPEKEQVILNFLDAAFSQYPWNGQASLEAIRKIELDKAGTLKKYYQKSFPWLYEYVYREQGMPRADVVNKWKSSTATVGLYWPEVGEMSLNIGQDISQEQKKILVDQIALTSKRLNELSAFRFQFLDNAYKSKEASDFPKIRLIPTSKDVIEAANEDILTSYHGLRKYVANIKGGIEFSHKKVEEPRGFFVTDASNNITFSACFVVMDAGETVIRNQIASCLLRSIGLPNSMYSTQNSDSGPDLVSTANEVNYAVINCKAVQAGADKNAFVVSMLRNLCI